MKHTLSIRDNQLSYIKGTANRKKIKIYNDVKLEINKGIINNGVINDVTTLSEILKNFRDKHMKNKKVDVIIDSTNILLREISVPKARKKELDVMIQNEIINSIGNIDDYIKDYIILNREGTKYNILVLIMKKQLIKDYLDVFKEAGIAVNSLDISSNAIAKLFSFIEKKENTFIILDIDMESINLYLIDDDCCVWSKNIKLSLLNFKKNNVLNIAFEEISDHINRTLQFQTTRNKQAEIKSIYITGSIFELSDLIKTIEYNTNLKCIKFNSQGLIKGKNKFIYVKDHLEAIGALIKRR